MYRPKRIGNRGERTAAEYLKSRGYYIRALQWHSRWGEIDIVAYHPRARTLVCVEVKTRRTIDPADELISWRQRRRLARTIAAYLQATGYTGAVRCDLVIVQGGMIRHINNIQLE